MLNLDSCIMLELFCKKPVFQSNDEINQLEVIHSIMGTPNELDWPGVTNLPWYELVKPKEELPSRFRDLFAKCVGAMIPIEDSADTVLFVDGYRLRGSTWQRVCSRSTRVNASPLELLSKQLTSHRKSRRWRCRLSE